VAAAADLDALADRLGGGTGWPGRGCLPGLSRPGIRLPHRRLPGLGHRARLGGPLGTAYVTDDVRQRLKVVGSFLRRVWRQPDHVPAARHDEPRGVHLAQVP
jgi:hypothetical protein